MIFWGFFALSVIRLIFANETKDIEISFNKTNFMQCSITCPSFPKDINLMHNPTCEFPIPTTTSSSSTTSTTPTTTTPPTTSKTPPPTTPPSTPPPTTSPSTSKTPPTTSSSTSTSTTPTTTTTTTTTTATTPILTTTGTSPSTTTTITPTTTTTSSTSTTNTPPTQTSSPTPSTPPPTSTPTNVCGEIKKQVCLNGDPHYRTFDGSHFEYQGTCPHTFVERCNGIEDFDYFSVKVKNQRFGKNQSYPYHYQDILNNNEISITKNEKKISLISTNNGKSGIQVHLNSHTLCVDIPDCPEYFGTDKLCGLAGSYNGYCGDDLVYPNKTIVKDQGYPCTYGNEVNKWANAWRTNDYFSPSYYNDTKCDPGVDSVENRTCNFAIHECEPIRSALKGVKAFSQCKDLDYSEVYSEYSKCVDHLCEKKLSKCEALENFANFCETKLKDVALNTWRKELNCPKRKIGFIMNPDDEFYD